MIDLLSIKNEYSLLKTLPPEFIQKALANNQFKITQYNKNKTIHFDGEFCNTLEIVLFGKISIERIDESGNLLTITEFRSDDVLGGSLIFSKNPYYPMTITAKSETSILEISKVALFDLCATNTDFLKIFLELISDQALLLGNKIKHAVNHSIRESIVAFLKHEYALQGTATIRLTYTKKEFADRIGVQRTSLSRELQKMKNEGLICYDATSITILKFPTT